MPRPLTAFLLLCLCWSALLQPSLVQSAERPVVFRLDYATVHGGLKKALPPPGRAVPKLGLALAGGGARAAASVGVLKVLDRERIPVAAIAGTSMGALVGGLYAAGYSPDEIERIFLGNDWDDIFTDTPSRAFMTQAQKEARSRHLLEFTIQDWSFAAPTGLTAGQKLTNLLVATTLAASVEADMDFDRLRTPFRAVAADIETGEAVAIGRGLLHDALRASSAIPLLFQPVEIAGRLYVDGGMANNLPVDVARALGADVVIAVDPSARPEQRDQLTSLFSIVNQAISLQVRRTTEQQLLLSDLVISPQTGETSFLDFPSMAAAVRKGEDAAREALPRIRELMRPRSPGPRPEGPYRIANLAVEGNSAAPEELIRAAMATALVPRPVSGQEVLGALSDVFAIGLFSDVKLELVRTGRQYNARLTVTENPLVREISVTGSTLVTAEEVRSLLFWQQGRTLNSGRLAAALDALVERLQDQGYLLARVEHAGMAADGGTLEISLSDGRVDAIFLTGQTLTRRSLIQRETGTRAGEPLNFNTAASDIQRLYALDYFESLDVGLHRSDAGGVNLTVRIKDKPTTRLRIGLRYDLEDAFTGLTDIVMDNITGRGIKAFLNARYGNYTDLALGYHSPIIIRSHFVHSLQAFYRQREYTLYQDQHRVSALDVSRTGIDFAFGYQWFRFGDTFLRYRFSSDRTIETIGLSPPKTIGRVGSIAFLTTMDTRDSDIFPHRGVLVKGSYENASASLGSTQEFAKTTLLGQGSLPLGERHTVRVEVSAGLGSGSIPYHEQYGIGGADHLIATPLVGYHRREFTGSSQLGCSLTWQWKLAEYQLSAVRGLYLTLTGQAANVWDSRDAMSTNDLRYGGGIGIHADTIIGPFRLEAGAGEDDHEAIYFSAGFDF